MEEGESMILAKSENEKIEKIFKQLEIENEEKRKQFCSQEYFVENAQIQQPVMFIRLSNNSSPPLSK